MTSSGGAPFDDDEGDPFDFGTGDHAEGVFDDHASKGWIDPDDRIWRHPSELSGWLTDDAAASVLSPGLTSSRRRMAAMYLVGTAAAAAAIVGVVVLNTLTPNGNPLPVVAPLHAATVTTEAFTTNPVGVEQTTVKLVSLSARGAVVGCGVVVAQGGYVATTMDLVRGASAVMVWTAEGDLRASVIGMDPTSDIALLQVPLNPPVAQFEDDSTLAKGAKTTVLTVSRVLATGRWEWSTSTVESVGTPVTTGKASSMGGIVAADPQAAPLSGAPLLNSEGDVIGILDNDGASVHGERSFLPAGLVLGVTNELATWGTVRHGWLGVGGADANSQRGALIESVDPTGAAAHALLPGDVIDGVGGARIRSMAELRSRLYVMSPGTLVHLQVMRDNTPMTVDVELAASP